MPTAVASARSACSIRVPAACPIRRSAGVTPGTFCRASQALRAAKSRSGWRHTTIFYGTAPYSVTKAAITTLMECLYGQLRDIGSKIHCGVVIPGFVQTTPNDDAARHTAEMLRRYGYPATPGTPAEIAAFTLDSIEHARFWAHPSVSDDQRLTGGRHRETLEWVDAINRTRAETMARRLNPDPYLWGPPSPEAFDENVGVVQGD
jgi:NAD(P)-dependent dehydrogenase (short-subunit alcohol dehydrogenase family)